MFHCNSDKGGGWGGPGLYTKCVVKQILGLSLVHLSHTHSRRGTHTPPSIPHLHVMEVDMVDCQVVGVCGSPLVVVGVATPHCPPLAHRLPTHLYPKLLPHSWLNKTPWPHVLVLLLAPHKLYMQYSGDGATAVMSGDNCVMSCDNHAI